MHHLFEFATGRSKHPLVNLPPGSKHRLSLSLMALITSGYGRNNPLFFSAGKCAALGCPAGAGPAPPPPADRGCAIKETPAPASRNGCGRRAKGGDEGRSVPRRWAWGGGRLSFFSDAACATPRTAFVVRPSTTDFPPIRWPQSPRIAFTPALD